MFPSWRLGRPFGINLFLHWSFWLLPLWTLWTAHPDTDVLPVAMQLGVVFSLVGCVVLHELGHALTARHFGIRTDSIVLTPIGGIARFVQPIRSPWQEFCISLAGPLVNLVIAAGLGAMCAAAAALFPGWLDTLPGLFLFMLLLLNLIMAVLNLLPAFPMDGGRVLRALLAGPLGALRATRIAVNVGTVVAVLGGLCGVLMLRTPWPLAIALFVLWTGRRELAALEAETRQSALPQDEIVPLRSTAAWPTGTAPVTTYVWDALARRWVPER